jgi:hypothetical protein
MDFAVVTGLWTSSQRNAMLIIRQTRAKKNLNVIHKSKRLLRNEIDTSRNLCVSAMAQASSKFQQLQDPVLDQTNISSTN